MKVIPKQCAIYCRKSSEEGLDQEFNSLDAQRESCEAYITSQRAEGWQIIPTHYDDGGYSGGNMNRPALQALLEDIKAGKVQTVVVYKIDRLTRSLMDFSKLVDIFDEHGVTFVSVTQSFNTTTSMGRLTLNVLLSFAQFEREVTSERIRDKIAASKKKGMWMGGVPPVGYQLRDRKLIPHPEELVLVQRIFETYNQCHSVRLLHEKLKQDGVATPVRTSTKMNMYGGAPFKLAQLYKILRNPVYIGKIRHKTILHDGQHEPIIDVDLFHDVQNRLDKNSLRRKDENTKSGALLRGLLFDNDGCSYSPTYTSKNGRQYSYYISQNLIQQRRHRKDIIGRIPSHDIEKIVTRAIDYNLNQVGTWQNALDDTDIHAAGWIIENLPQIRTDFLKEIIGKVILHRDRLDITIDTAQIRKAVIKRSGIHMPAPCKAYIHISTPYEITRGANGTIILEGKIAGEGKDPLDLPADQLKRIVCGTIWREDHFDGTTLKDIAAKNSVSENHVRRCIYDSFDLILT